MKYLLDSNTFIDAKNRYYGMSFCPGFWSWIQNEYILNNIASIESVYQELRRGNDDLSEWVKNNKDIFLEVSDQQTQMCFVEIAAHVVGLTSNFKQGIVDSFLSGADPWLIAKAKSTNSVVVTQESFNPENKKKILIPNICRTFGIEFINTFELLQLLEPRFVLEQ